MAIISEITGSSPVFKGMLVLIKSLLNQLEFGALPNELPGDFDTASKYQAIAVMQIRGNTSKISGNII